MHHLLNLQLFHQVPSVSAPPLTGILTASPTALASAVALSRATFVAPPIIAAVTFFA
jgi:hypothetical protein